MSLQQVLYTNIHKRKNKPKPYCQKITMEAQEMATNTHILAIPFPLQGHINPMVQLSKRLVSKGIRVTLVTTATISSMLQVQSCSDLINIETIHDSTVEEPERLDIYEVFIHSFKASMTSGLPEIIQKHRNSSFPLKAIVYDSVIPWILDIAHVNGLKGAVLFTQPCCVCSIFYHMHRGSLEIPHDVDSKISLPGMPIMGLKDLPSLIYDMDSYPALLRLLVEQFLTFEKADWRLFNTFDKLEDEILKWMANQYPILTIGPTIPSMYLDKRIPGNYDYVLSLFKPNDESCMKWLDTKGDNSVVYVSFGSLLNHGEKQMEELAQGLIDCKCSFLWVVKDPNESKLPKDFTPDNGLIVNWCPQLEVLSHRAVGCFLSHCGWNSTLEAVSLGVPIVAMPQWSDQTTNAKFIVDVWGIGVRVESDENGVVTRDEVGGRVREVMHGERGRAIRRNVLQWRDVAKGAMSEGGSSDGNVLGFVGQLVKA